MAGWSIHIHVRVQTRVAATVRDCDLLPLRDLQILTPIRIYATYPTNLSVG